MEGRKDGPELQPISFKMMNFPHAATQCFVAGYSHQVLVNIVSQMDRDMCLHIKLDSTLDALFVLLINTCIG